MKNLIAISLLAAALALIFVWGKSNGGSTVASIQGAGGKSAPSALLVAEAFYDFGTISMRDGLVEKSFTVTNPTAEDIFVLRLVTSCMCTTAYIVSPDGQAKGPYGMPGHSGYVPLANELIKAGESRVIRVVYDPNAHGPAGVGPIDRFVTLTDEKGGTLQLEIKALVKP